MEILQIVHVRDDAAVYQFYCNPHPAHAQAIRKRLRVRLNWPLNLNIHIFAILLHIRYNVHANKKS